MIILKNICRASPEKNKDNSPIYSDSKISLPFWISAPLRWNLLRLMIA